ncbi:MAG: hypothetical protein ACRC5C_04930 [Bacilli bacterium]
MALFPNVNGSVTFKGKTHTNLVVSEGNAPAEELIISRENGAEPFIYNYGPEGNQTCVLAKGKIVELVGQEFDADVSRKRAAVKQATDGSTKVAGVNFHNVYSKRRDGMHSTLTMPTVITRNYIELPLFEHATLDNAQTLAEAMKFGAAVSSLEEVTVGEGADAVQVTTAIQEGDYVVSDRSGNFRKYIEGKDNPKAIVGQVWAKETNLPPAGFLQYYQELVNPEMEDFLKQLSYAPSPGKNGQDVGAYPYGAPHTIKGWKPEFEKMLNNTRLNGIPFLTDGFFRAQETKEFDLTNATYVEAIHTTDNITMDATKLTLAPGETDGAVFIKISKKMDITKLADFKAKVKGAFANADDVHIDVKNNVVVIYLSNTTDKAVEYLKTEIKVVAPLVIDPIAGIPTHWDYKGSVGAIRVLLQK